MAKSIETAWAGLQSQLGRFTLATEPTPMAKDAARALALVGFELGWSAATGRAIDHAEGDYGAIEDPGCICSYHIERRRIEALGR